MVPYNIDRSLITKAMMCTTTIDNDEIVVYITRHEKREWL